MKIRIQHSPWEYAFHFAAFDQKGDANFLGKPIEFSPFALGSAITDPTFSMKESEAQELFDELWRAGLRPRDGTGNSGHIEALKYHLEDMRKLVFEEKK